MGSLNGSRVELILGEKNGQEDEDNGDTSGGISDPLEQQRVYFFVLAVIPIGRARGLRIVFSHTRTFLLAGAASTVAFATIFAARKRESAPHPRFLCAAAGCGLKINAQTETGRFTKYAKRTLLRGNLAQSARDC
jgi:hypothetical protein